MGTKQKILVRKTVRAPRVYAKRLARWWLHNDRTHRLRWRLTNAAAALLILSTVALPIVQQQLTNNRYRLSTATLDLVGKNNQALSSKLKYNAQTAAYEFNKEAIKEYNPVEALQQQVGAANEKTKLLYALEVPSDPKKGVMYHDVNSKLSFKLVPQFSSLPGKTEQGRIVYPLDNGPQAVYTLKNNGLKEDIVVAKAKEDTLRFTYAIEIPKTLEARQLPDGSGAIGIYSGDPTLFSNMSYGSDKDRQLVEKARENAEKTNLIFGIPAPTITTKDGKQGSASARFELRGNQLTVVAEKLTSIQGAFSIDPSVVVTSTSDFVTKGNDEGNIDFGTNQISRGALTGGTVGSWSAANGGTASFARISPNVVAYEGYLYIGGGFTVATPNVQLNDVSYAAINSSTGQLGNWSSASNFFTGTRYQTTLLGYNGYLYMIGGASAGNTAFDDAQYALICTGSNSGVGGCGSTAGDLGTWFYANGTLTQAGATGVDGSKLNARAANAPTFVYNGHIYVVGGCNATPSSSCNANGNTVTQVAAINANGTIGIWSNSSAGIPSTMYIGGGAVAYNGVAYLVGGCSAKNGLNQCTAWTSHRAYIGADGTLGAWVSLDNAVSLSDNTGSLTVYKGYLYYSVAGATNKVAYTQIYANGSVGPWAFTTAYGTPRYNSAYALYNGYAYLVEGCTNSSTNCQSPNGSTADIQFAKIDDAGVIGSYASTTDYDTAGNERTETAAVASNGYIYLIGGKNTTDNTVRSAQINSDGSLGTWGPNTAFTDGRIGAKAVAYGGSIYLVGGVRSGSAGTAGCTQAQTSFYCQEVTRATIGSSGTLTWNSGDIWTYSTQGRSGLAAVINGGYLYVLGGRYQNNSQVTSEVDYAKICDGISTTGGCSAGTSNAGKLGTFTSYTSGSGALITARGGGLDAIAWNNHIYVVGGQNNTTTEYATFGSNGAITSWTDAGGGTFPIVQDASIVGYNGYIYVTGGNNTGALQTTTYIAKICDGVSVTGGCSGVSAAHISTWTVSKTFTTARSLNSSVAYNGYLYVMAGCKGYTLTACTSFAKDVQYAPINNGAGGSSLAWNTTTSMNQGEVAAGSVAYNGYLYVMGGCTAIGCALFTARNVVQHAAINSDGTIGAWDTTNDANLPDTRAGFAVVAYAGKIYVVGGRGTNAAPTVYMGTPNTSTGIISSWTPTSNYIGTRTYLSAFAYNNYMYLVGGSLASASTLCNAVSDTLCQDIQYAHINSDGTLGSWHFTHNSADDGTTFAGGFTTARQNQVVTVNNGYVYITGGFDTSNNALSDVQYAQLNPNDGTVGSWSFTSPLPQTRSISLGYAYNGYLYVYQGKTDNSSGSLQPTVLYVPINPNGTLGNWTTSITPMTGDPTTRSYGSGALYNGYIYYLGGQSASISTTVSYAPLQITPRTAQYSKFIDFGRNTNIKQLTYNGTVSDLTSISIKAADSTGVFGSSSTATAIAPTGTCTGNFSLKRYLLVTVSFDDSRAATWGETAGSSITDFTVSYNYVHPPPNIRLRTGQTLQSGDLSPLDTCGTMAY